MSKAKPKKTVPKPSASSGAKAAAKSAWKLKLFSIIALGMLSWLVYLDAQVRYKFEGKRWHLPAQVLARPLELFEGQALNPDNLEQELALLEYTKNSSVDRPGTYWRDGSRIELFRRAHDTIDGPQSALKLELKIDGDVIRSIELMSEAPEEGIYTIEPYKIGGIYPKSREERELVAYEDIPSSLVSALLATEDRNFFDHWGVSPLSIARAMFANLQAGRVVQGGSTLTQQLVKNFYLTRERSIARKVNEALMAVLLEVHYTKADILETYVNDIYLGQSGSTAIHGFAMASRFYFAKNLRDLELEEAALLVAILKGPSYYDPRRHPQRAQERRDLVLSLMHQENWIALADAQQAQAEPLRVTHKPSFQTNRYPAFIDLVKRQLSRDYQPEDLSREGLKIYTTLDPQLQKNLERAVTQGIKALDRRQASGSATLETGAVITEVGTGEVMALLGGRNPRYHGFNRALDAERAVGSLIKPAIYLAALEQPEHYQLATKITDAPFALEFENGERWTPSNFDNKVHGEVAMVEALSNSYNLAAARLGVDIGLDKVHQSLRRLGVKEALNPYPSLLLGAQSMTPFDVAKFYQTIASNGFNMPLRAIREVANHKGEPLSRFTFEVEQVISPQASYLLQSGLQEVMRNGSGRSAYKILPTQLLTAGKTGTTNDFRDSWFAGFSGDYLGVFWVGKDNNEPAGLTGSSGALKLWTKFMASVPQYPLATPLPSDIYIRWFDQSSWSETSESCENAQPLPVWGDDAEFDWQACRQRSGSIKSWIRSWFQF